MLVASSVSKTHFVGSVYRRADIKTELAKRGFYPPLLGLTVHKLKSLNLEQYSAMLDLLGRVGDFTAQRLQFADRIPLILPGGEDLRAIKIDRIVGNERAMAEILNRCLKFDHGLRLDLTILPWIYKNFVA
jgi:hypothetical protein